MQSHAVGELRALCVGEPGIVYTGGQDKILFKWQATSKSKKALMRTHKNYPIESIDYCPQLKTLAIGYINGEVEFLDADLK